MKQTFNGYLTQYTGDSRDNTAIAKISIKCKDMSSVHAVLNPFTEADEGIAGANSFVESNGYGNAKFSLINPLKLYVNFDAVQFDANLVSISVKKKMESDGGDSVEYCFNFEKEPTDDDIKLWVTYLKYKSVPEDDESKSELYAELKEENADNPSVVEALDELENESNGKKKKKKKKKASIVEYQVDFNTEGYTRSI